MLDAKLSPGGFVDLFLRIIDLNGMLCTQFYIQLLDALPYAFL